MSFRRVWVVGAAAVVLAAGVVAACGDTTNITNVVVQADAGPETSTVDSDGSTVDASGEDAENDAAMDSGADAFDANDGSACNAAPLYAVSDDCAVIEPCTITYCAAGTEPMNYKCSNNGHPSLSRCFHVGGITGGSCCAPACVRQVSKDGTCTTTPSTPHAFSCAYLAFDASIYPSPTCTGITTANPNELFACCP